MLRIQVDILIISVVTSKLLSIQTHINSNLSKILSGGNNVYGNNLIFAV